jgi:hypothetical protein
LSDPDGQSGSGVGSASNTTGWSQVNDASRLLPALASECITDAFLRKADHNLCSGM